MLAALGIISALIGVVIGGVTWQEEKNQAEREAAKLEKDARDQARLAMENAQAALSEAVGQLGALRGRTGNLTGGGGQSRGTYQFETYDDWYDAQMEEYSTKTSDGSYSGSFEDYLREQQVTELGQYGIERAQLELQVAIAEERLDQTRRNIEQQFGFGERQYQEGVIAANRTTRGEAAAAAAYGVRGGTISETVAENQRVRGEALQLYLDQITWQRDLGMEQVATAGHEIAASETIAMGGLDQALANARGGYQRQLKGIKLDLTQYTEGLDLQMDKFTLGSLLKSMASGGMAGVQLGFGTFAAGEDAGLWGYDADGTFWSNLQIFSPSATGSSGRGGSLAFTPG